MADTTITIGGDGSEILKVLAQIQTTFAAMADDVKKFADSAEPALQQTASGVKDIGDNLTETTTLGAFFGVQLGKAFDIVVASLIDAVKAFPQMIDRATEAADRLGDLSKSSDISVEALSQLKFVASQTGVSFEGLVRTVSDMGRLLQQGSETTRDAITSIGLNLEELKQQQPEEAFMRIMEALGNLPTAGERAAAGVAIFGGKFRTMANLTKEDIRGLMQQADELGLTLETRTAVQADKFRDAIDVMDKMMDAARNRIVEAFLPALIEIAETAPQAGGAILLIGKSALDAASALGSVAVTLVPLLGLWGKADKALFTIGNTLPVLTARLWLMDVAAKAVALSTAVATTAMGAFLIASGPVIVAIAGITAALTIGYQAWQLYTESKARWEQDAKTDKQLAQTLIDINTKYGQSFKTVAEAVEFMNQRIRGAVPAAKAAGDGIAEAMKKAGAELEKFLAVGDNKQRLTAAFAAMKAGVVDLKQIKEEYKLSEEALKLFNFRLDENTKALDKQKQAFEQSPMGKFLDTVKDLKTEIDLATKAGASMKQLIEAFGKDAVTAAAAARLIPGALATLPPIIQDVANAFNKAELAEIMKEIRAETVKVEKDIKAAAQAMADASGKSLTSTFVAWSKMQQDLEILRKTGLDKELAMIDRAEQEELASLGLRTAANAKYYDELVSMTKEKYDEQRKLVMKYTGDVVRDAAMRGTKTRAELQLIADVEKKHLADMQRVQGQFTQTAIDQQRKRAVAAQEAADGERKALSSIADAFVRMGQVAQGSLGSILGGVGELIVALDSAQKLAKEGAGQFGVLSVAFDSSASSVDRFAAGIAAAATVAQGVSNVMAATSKHATAAGNALGGALAGAKAGAAFGPWGIAIGAAAGLVIGIIKGKPAWAKAATEVGRDFGVKISKELGEAIAKTAKEDFGGDRFAASLVHMTDIIKEAGGVTNENFDKLAGKMRDTFVMFKQGTFDLGQTQKILDENFGAFAQHVLQSNEIAADSFVELIRLNNEMGTKSKAITDFVAGQTSRLGNAFSRLMEPARKSAEDFNKTLKEEQEELKQLIEARDKDQKATKEETAAIDAQTKVVNDLLAKQKEMGTTSLPEIERAARLMTASFNAAIASGVSMVDAIDQMGPGLDSILKTMENLGINVEQTSAAWILAFRNRVNANRELVDSASSLNEIMLAMSNIGALNVDTMADLQAQGVSTFEKLRAAGFSENESLNMIKGFLENVRKAHTDLGLPIDANTQKLINQATASGVLKEEQMSMNDIMLEGLSAIIKALGGDLPNAWKAAADAAKEATDTAAAGLEGVADETTDLSKSLGDTPWGNWAGRGTGAATIAGRAVDGTEGAVSDVDRALMETDWDRWAREAADAAEKAKEAVDGVATGHSPGGVRQIATEFRKASDAAEAFAETMRGQMARAGIQTNMADGSVIHTAARATSGAVTPTPIGGDDVHLTFVIQSLDSAGVEDAVETRILPAMAKTLRRGRHLRELQSIMGSS